MARKKSEFVRSLGIAFQVFMALVNEVLDQGGTDDDIRRIETDATLRKEIAALVVGKKKPAEVDIDQFVTSFNDDQLSFQMADLAQKWRKLADHLGYSGPVAWEIKAGFTLKKHAPLVGPCYEKFQYIQNWDFTDESTRNAIVFWIPRLVPESTNKTASEQKEILTNLRMTFWLPKNHLNSFGSSALLAALILKHFKLTGEMVPLDHYWVRTDTRRSGGHRLRLRWGGDSLDCGGRWGERGDDRLGAFALGVEALGT